MKIPAELSSIQELVFATELAQAGGDVLLRHRKEGTVIREKARNDLVSEADLESERVIKQAIANRYPDHVILAEESENGLDSYSEADHLWIIDPLDGTTNFAHGIPHFAVSIAYYQRGVAKCGVVWNPAREELFCAVAGEGAWFQGEQMHVGTQTRMTDVLIAVGFYYDRGAMMRRTLRTIEGLFAEQIRGIRRFGTASLDLCGVASGVYGGFVEYQLAPWDFAAGRLIVEEAGGKVTTSAGDDLPISVTSVLATNSVLHPAMLDVIAASELPNAED
ncbi:Inositol-1-monophosphatase [Thalassoglobus neptunius]|uniref:Inositol-1-monophosphatase n=1 Tax=Thalassoglobus neptunius TaxID=1938619 RepID=A0A5C5WN12_9PLAN|nr:inositol monophosphatase family protein [Thalassoglobus neptunius]TWT52204.1 Inositol-1-monophosphatase [Thalassoglobus neptunius]